MSDFSITKAAFSGWGLAARRPALTAVLGILGIAAGVGIAAMTVAVAGPQMAELRAMTEAQRAGGGAPPNPQAMFTLMGPIIQFSILALLAGLVLAAVNTGAVNRAVLRPNASKFPFLGLTGDELRIMTVFIVLGLVIGLPSLVLLVIGNIISVIIGVSIAGQGAMQQMGQGGSPPAAILTGVFVVYGVVGVAVFLAGARFALSAAQTVAERGVRIFGSWELTRGRYWKVVGTLVLSLVSLIPAACVAGIILFGVARATGVELKSLAQPDYSTMAAIMTPLSIARYVLGGLMGALGAIVGSSATAHIYNAVSGGAVAGVADDDDDEDWED